MSEEVVITINNSINQQYYDDFNVMINAFQDKKKELEEEYSWDKDRDVRITTFNRFYRAAYLAKTLLIIKEKVFDNDENFKLILGEQSKEAIEQWKGDYNRTAVLLGLFFSTFCDLETFFRRINHSICKFENDNFSQQYSHLLNKLELSKYAPLLDYLRLMRNSFHNNGVYNKSKKEVKYSDELNFTFELGIIIVPDLKLLLTKVYPEIATMLYEIVKHQSVSEIEKIEG